MMGTWNRRMMRSVLLVLGCAPLVAGCIIVNDNIEDIAGTTLDPKTKLEINIVADGTGKTHVEACSSDASLSCLEINGPITASNGGVFVDLPFVVDHVEADGTKVGSFMADLMGDADGTEITVKSKATATADPGSVVALPKAPIIATPAADAMISAATDTIKLTWSPSGEADRLEWTSAIVCPSKTTEPALQGAAVTDTGTLEILPKDLVLPAGETCSVEIILRRGRDGVLEKAFQGRGGIAAVQSRSVTVTVTP